MEEGENSNPTNELTPETPGIESTQFEAVTYEDERMARDLSTFDCTGEVRQSCCSPTHTSFFKHLREMITASLVTAAKILWTASISNWSCASPYVNVLRADDKIKRPPWSSMFWSTALHRLIHGLSRGSIFPLPRWGRRGRRCPLTMFKSL